ncbi:cobalt-precorrin-5B (C(1))-methyltransferase [Pseudooceanicola algae]|uniref:Cobalt-precorrin-5B C(1)-methyltransferase n=1 Tax=Pseudooceanicola algae TaxID=1537215 RepID=A0A7T1FNP3_9RHOB|nr:cobalt-precorrin-5B (C(1))-methyltransferase [Pseudooceanicola algae]QPM89896.1 Cobalt-precorrin-5B C(1)-methyltransferase [Pseudooceanicola algae]
MSREGTGSSNSRGRGADPTLRRGWTTGACATAALKTALLALWSGTRPDSVGLRLPRGETPVFTIEDLVVGDDWAEAAIIKDAGDDPDVTHGALVRCRVAPGGQGIRFVAGPGVGTVTRPGLPLPVGAAAINPVPRQMMEEVLRDMAALHGRDLDAEITVSVRDGEALAAQTWNPRLGILGGLSILGTTGVVRPFSCSAWIASIHRGVDVARAGGSAMWRGDGATSERVVQELYDLPDHAMLDMGDFAGGLLKYLSAHPVEHVTIAGGIGKLTKLGQGAGDLHSGRSQVDFATLADVFGRPEIAEMQTALAVLDHLGPVFGDHVAGAALAEARRRLPAGQGVDVVVIDRAGQIVGRA